MDLSSTGLCYVFLSAFDYKWALITKKFNLYVYVLRRMSLASLTSYWPMMALLEITLVILISLNESEVRLNNNNN
jgi:hypothetical protein